MTPLFSELRDEILANGPIGLDRYMALCLGHPIHGYYRNRDPFGVTGDFTTAPEISQMFGELVGLWIASVAAAMTPGRLILVELGPGRGTLMADALRAISRVMPGLSFELHLVETSPVLKALQAQRLEAYHPTWHEEVACLPEGPAIVIANEFFDALPIRQFQRTERGWCERLVGLDPEVKALVFGLSAEPDRTIAAEAPVGILLTLPGVALDLTRRLAGRLALQGGVCLAIDYGHRHPGFGDTLQAVEGHRFVDPLARPGEADLTSHVDFAALAKAAESAGARVQGPVEQRDFLLRLGLAERAERLVRGGNKAQAEAVAAAFARLTETGRRGMGSLFKAMAFGHPGLRDLPGFETGDPPQRANADIPTRSRQDPEKP